MSVHTLLVSPAAKWSDLNSNSLQVNQDIVLTPISTTVRDDITPQDGMLVYNSDDVQFQGYLNGEWVQLVGSPTGFVSPPYAETARAGFTGAGTTGIWVDVNTVYQPENSRPGTGSWLAVTGGVKTIQPSPTNRNLLNISCIIAVANTVDGEIGIRVMNIDNGGVVASTICPTDGTTGPTGQIISTSNNNITNVNTSFKMQVLNLTDTAPLTISRAEMNLINFGPV